MFSVDLLREMYRHMEWADAEVWKAVPVNGAIDQKLRAWLVHIHMVQRAFLHVWTTRPLKDAFRNADEFETLADIQAWARPYYAEAHTFIGSLSPQRLAEPLQLPWAAEIAKALGRVPGPSTLGDTCFQVASHSTYHRGQVNARLREIGTEPPLVDYIAWVWFGRPAAEWPSRGEQV